MSVKASIIIPVYNDNSYLKSTLTAILDQIVEEKDIEVIIVDNGSTNNPSNWIEQTEQVKLLNETRNLNSPYSCRNRGVEIARGNVIILLDSTCRPKDDWLKKGLDSLAATGADIVGGNVLFDFEGRITGAKLFDAMTNIRMEESIAKGIAKTANLFIKRSVFETIGLFPEGIRSGADVRWTYKATSLGMKLVFCSDAIVYKPARGFTDLLKKQWRVGLHQPLIWKEVSKSKSRLRMLAQIFTPVNPSIVRRNMRSKFGVEVDVYFIPLLFTAQLNKSIMGLANFIGSFRTN